MSAEAKKQTPKFIPEELLMEILKRVPTKSLIKFMCVCKSWKALIVSSRFITTQLDHTHNTDSCTNGFYLLDKYSKTWWTLCSDDLSLSEIALLPHPFCKYSEVTGDMIGTVNGLVCLRYRSYDRLGPNDDYVLWNPLIRKIWELPRFMDTWNLRCDLILRGFGFDCVNDDYKVVMIRSGFEEPFGSVHLCSLRSGTWRALNAKPSSLMSYSRVCFKGNVHWLSFENREINVFDMVAEEFKEAMLPDSVSETVSDKTLAVRREFLCLLVEGSDHKGLDVWVMKEYGDSESWIKQFTVNIEGGVKKFAGFRHSGELLTVAHGHLVSYFMETLIIEYSKHDSLFCRPALPFIGTLVLADIGIGCSSSVR